MSNAPIIPPDCAGLPPFKPNAVPRTDERPTTSRPSRHTADRFGTLNAFVDCTAARLTRAELVTWLVIWRDTKPSGHARTSQTEIARRGGMSDRAVRAALTKLVSYGLVHVIRRGGFRQGMSIYVAEAMSKPPE